jgi:hypothetical protein
MPAIPLDALPEAANRDPEFRIAARFWDCRLRIDEGERGRTIRIERGRITTVEPAERGASWDLRIGAAAEQWARLLEPVPRPFYQDLYGAAMHHGFELHGNLEHHLFPYYPALRRLVELLRGAAGR